METPKFCQTNVPLSIDAKTNDHFIIDYLLDFPNDDEDAAADSAITNSTPVDTSSNSSFCTAEPHFPAADIGGPRGFVDGHSSNDLCVPYDDLAELEWLSRFTDESFSSEDLQKLQIIQGMKARTDEVPQAHQYQFQPGATRPGPVTGKARSKRSRAASGSWPSCFITATPSAAAPTMLSSEPDIVATATAKASPGKPAVHKKKEVPESSVRGGGEGRKCLHCATDKTPQWRTGPLGPKTLCNACGVRFKSGRLVPEYRPAASPTFVLTKHSNSHRKVLELRRQKEMVWTQQQFLHHHHQPTVFDASNGDDFLIHQHLQQEFRQLI